MVNNGWKTESEEDVYNTPVGGGEENSCCEKVTGWLGTKNQLISPNRPGLETAGKNITEGWRVTQKVLYAVFLRTVL